MDLDPVNDLYPPVDFAGLQVNPFGYLPDMLINHRMESTLGENVNEHGQCERILENRVFRIDVGATGQGMTSYNRHELSIKLIHNRAEEIGVLQLVSIKAFYEILPGVNDDLLCQRQRPKSVDRSRFEFQRALVLKLVQDILFDFLDSPFRVNEMVAI